MLSGAAYFIPRMEMPDIQFVIRMREEFLMRLTSTHITEFEKDRILKLPVPAEVGALQLTVERHNTGFYRLWPQYSISVSPQ